MFVFSTLLKLNWIEESFNHKYIPGIRRWSVGSVHKQGSQWEGVLLHNTGKMNSIFWIIQLVDHAFLFSRVNHPWIVEDFSTETCLMFMGLPKEDLNSVKQVPNPSTSPRGHLQLPKVRDTFCWSHCFLLFQPSNVVFFLFFHKLRRNHDTR